MFLHSKRATLVEFYHFHSFIDSYGGQKSLKTYMECLYILGN